MKKTLIYITVFFLGLGTVLAQTDRAKELQTQIDKAVLDGDYRKASELKKELENLSNKSELQKEIDKAVEEGDYRKAAELKKQLNNESSAPAQETAEPVRNEQPVANNNSNNATPNTNGSSKFGSKHKGFFMDAIIGGSRFNYSVWDDYDGYKPLVSGNFTIGFKAGQKFYFGNFGNMGIGVQVTYLKFTAHADPLGPSYIFSPANVGFSSYFILADKHKIEANVNAGIYLSQHVWYNGKAIFGTHYNLEARYYLSKKMNVGIEIGRYAGNDLSDWLGTQRVFSFTPTVGFKF